MGKRRKSGGRTSQRLPQGSTQQQPPSHANPSPQHRSKFDQLWLIEDYASTALVLVICTTLYVRTLYPTVAGGDSGELVAQSCTLGIAHPPGYPLFTLLSHAAINTLPALLETWAPLLLASPDDVGQSMGNEPTLTPAWYSNLFSSLCDAIAAVFVARTTKLCVAVLAFQSGAAADRAANVMANLVGAFSGLMFAFSPLIWTYAVGSEVFALNNLLMAVLVHTLVSYGVHRSTSYIYFGAFVCGLGLTNQHTAILFEMPMVMWVAWQERSRMLKRPGSILVAVLCGLAGLSPYLYLPWSALRQGQAGVWGDLATVGGFWHHFTRADYGTFKLYSRDGTDVDSFVVRTQYYLRDFVFSEATVAGGVLAFAGFLATSLQGVKTLVPRSLPQQGSIGGVLLALPLFYLAVFHSLSNMPLDEELLYGVHERFWQQPNIVAFSLLGIGAGVFAAHIRKLMGDTLWLATFGPLLALLVGYQISRSFHIVDRSDAWYFRDYVHGILGALPENSIYLAAYDIQWTAVVYMQKCEGYRTDIAAFNLPMLSFGWHRELHQYSSDIFFPGDYMNRVGSRTDSPVSGGREANLTSYDMRQFLQANLDKHAIFAGGDHVFVRDKFYEPAFEFVPDGYSLRAVRGKTESTRQFHATAEKAWAALRKNYPNLPPEAKYNPKTWEWTTRVDYWRKLETYSAELLARAVADKDGLMIVAAVRAIEELCVNEPDDRVPLKAIKNLGLGYARLVQEKNLDLPQDLNLFTPYSSYGPRPVENPRVFNSALEHPAGLRWKLQASVRTLEVWGYWVARAPNDDPDVPTIAKTVEVLQRAMSKSQGAGNK